MTDPIIEDVVKKFQSRSAVGLKKYGITVDQNNHDDFLEHAIEEAMDFIVYLRKIQKKLHEQGIVIHKEEN